MSTGPVPAQCVDCAELGVVRAAASSRSQRCATHQAAFRRFTKRASKHRQRHGTDYPSTYTPAKPVFVESIRMTPSILNELKEIEARLATIAVRSQWSPPPQMFRSNPWMRDYEERAEAIGQATAKLAKINNKLGQTFEKTETSTERW